MVFESHHGLANRRAAVALLGFALISSKGNAMLAVARLEANGCGLLAEHGESQWPIRGVAAVAATPNRSRLEPYIDLSTAAGMDCCQSEAQQGLISFP